MKKLITTLLFFICFCFISCFTEPKNDWDKDGVAYKNNSNFVPIKEEHETWTRTDFFRVEGKSGIIGKFTKTYIDSSVIGRSYSDTERYIFNEDGTYQYSHIIVDGGAYLKNFKINGKFKLYKYSDTFYLFEFLNRSDAMFYCVSNEGLQVYSQITDSNGEKIYAEKYVQSLH